jgi:hypothetical protein
VVLRQQIIGLRQGRSNRLPFLAANKWTLGRVLLAISECPASAGDCSSRYCSALHRAGLRSYWRWKSRRRPGRPAVSAEIRKLIREMSAANPLWGAPRLHGELLKLGIDIGQTSVGKYMVRARRPPSQGWTTFLRNHADGIAGDGPVRGADCFVSAALRAFDHGTRPATYLVAGRDDPSNGGMDCQSNHAGMRLGPDPELSDP